MGVRCRGIGGWSVVVLDKLEANVSFGSQAEWQLIGDHGSKAVIAGNSVFHLPAIIL